MNTVLFMVIEANLLWVIFFSTLFFIHFFKNDIRIKKRSTKIVSGIQAGVMFGVALFGLFKLFYF